MKHLILGPERIDKDPETNKMLKRMWELNNKRVSENLNEEETQYYNENLLRIKNYYANHSHYWDSMEELNWTEVIVEETGQRHVTIHSGGSTHEGAESVDE